MRIVIWLLKVSSLFYTSYIIDGGKSALIEGVLIRFFKTNKGEGFGRA